MAKISREYKSRVVRVTQVFHTKDPNTSIPSRLQPAEDPSQPPPTITPKPIVTIPNEPIKVQNASSYKCINDYFDKIFCINLDRRTDRWESALLEFNKNSLVVDRFSAIDGNNLEKTVNLNQWERACL